MEIKKPSFVDLEKQMARDTLEIALKDLHGEIVREIEKNKNDFSENINKTLDSFKDNIEQHISETLDQKIESRVEKNFQDINSQITSSFNQKFTPILRQTEPDMQSLREQGEVTSWKAMMLTYKALWTRLFFFCLLQPS